MVLRRYPGGGVSPLLVGAGGLLARSGKVPLTVNWSGPSMTMDAGTWTTEIETPFTFTDPAFNNGIVYAIIDDGSGGKFVGGSFTSVTCNVTSTTYTTGYTRLVHLLPTGEVDAAWSCPASSIVRTLWHDALSDTLFVGGDFNGSGSLGGAARNRLGAVTASTGVVIPTWVCSASASVLSLAMDSSTDTLFVGGSFSGAAGLGGAARNRLGAVTASTGVVIPTWVCDASDTVRSLCFVETIGILFVGGSYSGAAGLGGSARNYLGAVTASTGVVIPTWVCNASGAVMALVVDSVSDTLFVGGSFSGAAGLGGAARNRLGAVTASTGVVIPTWVCDASATVTAIRQDAGRDMLVVGGQFAGAAGLGGSARNYLGAVTASTGVVIPTWVCNSSDWVESVHIDEASDATFVGGWFAGSSVLDGQARYRLGTVVTSTGDLFVP